MELTLIVIVISCPPSRCLKLHLSLIWYNVCDVQYMLELFFFYLVFHADCVKGFILDNICFLIFDIIDVYLSPTLPLELLYHRKSDSYE
jgi:hypothetical protein